MKFLALHHSHTEAIKIEKMGKIFPCIHISSRMLEKYSDGGISGSVLQNV